MGRFNEESRKPGRGRRRSQQGKRRAALSPEFLESRTLLSGSPNDPLINTAQSSIDEDQIKNGPLAKGGQQLAELHDAFRQGGDVLQQTIDRLSEFIRFEGDKVGVDLFGRGDFDTYVKSLKNVGMDIIASDASFKIVEGFLPISQLRSVAEMAQTISLSPIFHPIVRTQGVANNQADEVLRADVARQQFGVDGTGVTIGVLSDSVDRFQGGLADSIATGDLPSDINVLLDEPVGGLNSDEGRAMLELIHDLAPGSDLAFHTATAGGTALFAEGIRRLADEAGAEIIVDDIGFANEPVFQDGVVAQAVIDVTENGSTFFSAAGNSGFEGIETDFRGVNADVGDIGQGRFLDFDPGPGVSTTLPIDVTAGGLVGLWWDDPWFNGLADSDVDAFLIDGTGAIVAQGVGNNIGSATPQELFGVNAQNGLELAIRVTNGPDPGRVRFQTFSATLDVSQQFGRQGGTTFPTTFGHPTSANAIGTAAVPFFGAPPFDNPDPILTEDFSSAGPTVIAFDPQGNPLPSREVRLKPDVAGVDGVNTTFFPPGGDIPQDPDDFPNFFGTSAAAPNLAAVGALMKQLNPNATFDQIQDAMIASAVPLNGAARGEWEFQGGFGLVDAVEAMNAVGQLRILNVTPGNGEVVGTPPREVTVEFSKPIDADTLDPSDLTFPFVPPGVTVNVGTPVVIDDETVSFPLSYSAAPDVQLNGDYVLTFAEGSITAQDGRELESFTSQFEIQDQTAPQVVNTIIQGRIIVVEFSEAMRPETVNRGTVQLVRTGGTGQFGRPENVIVTDHPNAVFFFDQASNRAIYDLRAVPQSVMPSDVYALVATDEVRDVTGLRLDGEFQGLFPTGNGEPGGNFAQPLGNRVLTAPQIIQLGLAPGSDTGIGGDQNTKQERPTLRGVVVNQFPGTNAGLEVAIQYIQDRPGGFDLDIGPNGRGFVGDPDQIVTTADDGSFTFQPPFDLRDGFHRVRIVVVGASEDPPLPGLATRRDQSFRVDTTNPLVTASSITEDARISSLRTLTLNVSDPVAPASAGDVLAVPTQLDFPALNPSTATNLSNYSLINVGPDRVLGTGDDQDLSEFLSTAEFTSTTVRNQPGDPFTGQIELTFDEGLPQGRYALIARTKEPGFNGVRDAAGNPLDNDPVAEGTQSFEVFFDLQPEPAFITNFELVSPSVFEPGTMVSSGPREFFEIPRPGFSPRAEAPPEQIVIDFSNTLDPDIDFSNAVQLVRSADSPAADPDGDFGTGAGGGFTVMDNATVSLVNQVPGATLGQPGFRNRLVIDLPENFVLPADYYRVILPNSEDGTIRDIFGNVADLEFLGNQQPSSEEFEVFMPDGTFRDGLTGDGVEGGSFVTGFAVAPSQRVNSEGRTIGNIIFARPDAQDDPFLPGDDPDGSRERPFPTLAPEAVPNALNGGDLNAQANFGTGFNSNFDRNGNDRFDRSAFVEAEQVAFDEDTGRVTGPVIVVALPGIIRPVPGEIGSGQTEQDTFVLQAPTGFDPVVNNGSASVPANTMLVFDAGSTLKLQNASLLVQNQGSSIQVRGGLNPSDRVTFTSFADDTVGGDTNGDGNFTTGTADRLPAGGDWGGLVLRNFDQRGRGNSFPVDGRLANARGEDAASGADDVMSVIDHATIRFGGGAIPVGGPGTDPQNLFRFDAITNFNSRPDITNVIVSDSGDDSGSGAQAAISGNLDSFREDMIKRGMLVRRTQVFDNTLNGIFVRAESGTGFVRQTDAIAYPDNPPSEGGTRNFVFDDPLPFLLTAPIRLGEVLVQDSGGQTTTTPNRLYIQPGMMVKADRGAGIELFTDGTSLNIGDRTYIDGFDRDNTLSPEDPDFRPNTTGDAKVIFTSLFDDDARTFFFDPATGVERTIVPPLDSDGGGDLFNPTPGNINRRIRHGGIGVREGTRIVADEAEFRLGGGSMNTPTGTFAIRPVLTFFDTGRGLGTRASITNNDFFDNFEAPIGIEPNGLLAADPLRPLQSGNPFFRGNVMQRNTYNGMRVFTSFGSTNTTNFPSGIDDGFDAGDNVVSQTVNAIWDDTDLTYVLRGTIQLAGLADLGDLFDLVTFQDNEFMPVPDPDEFQPERRPRITLTIQSQLPDTLLANGEQIDRPGESPLIKLLNFASVPGDDTDGSNDDSAGGAGFLVGVDDGDDPPADRLIDAGFGSQIRILGIGANEATGQERVPVQITSVFDDTVGKTVRGVDMFDVFPNLNPDPAFDPFAIDANGNPRNEPAPGDGGLIHFGGNMLTDSNLFDPRNGSIIDNADINFITRIEMQSGGIVDVASDSGDENIDNDDALREQKLGFQPLFQNNALWSMTVSNSNLSDFAQVGILARDGFDMIALRDVGPLDPDGGFTPVDDPLPARIGGVAGGPINLFLVNNTITNMPTGIRMITDREPGPFVDGDEEQEPFYLNLLHNTFHNNDTALNTIAPPGQIGPQFNPFSSVRWLAMNNIFANSSVEAITAVGQPQGSQGQHNLFFGNASDFSLTDTGVIISPNGGFAGLNGNVFGDPRFRDPDNGDFRLLPDSAAIDASRDVIGPFNFGNALRPIVDTIDPVTGEILELGIRNNVGRLGGLTDFGILPIQSNDLVNLPGSPLRDFFDQWQPVLAGTPGSARGSASNPATFSFSPVTGQRDQLGLLRLDDPNQPNVGAGGDPFFDIGALEFRTFDPPQVTNEGAPDVDDDGEGDGVIATIVDAEGNVSQVDIFAVGGVAGTNGTPLDIQIQLDEQLDPRTVNNLSVRLQASGGDGVFGNNNSTSDRFIDLSGKLDFDPETRRLTIGLGAENLLLGNDLFRITLVGTGSNVLRDPDGNALDGENLGPDGAQLPLPSGDGFPGGNFQVTFSIDSNPPEIEPATFVLAEASDSGPRDGITNVNPPSFTGRVTDIFPPSNPLVDQVVMLDIDIDGDGVFERMNVGSALTDQNGNFLVTVGTDGAGIGLNPDLDELLPLPDTQFNVGPDGLLFTPDDSGFSMARVRLRDVSGNESDPNDPNALAGFVVDTTGPRITSVSPTPNARLSPAERFTVNLTTSENVLVGSLLAPGALSVVGAGLDGQFNTPDDNTSANVDLSSLNVIPLANDPMGPFQISFDVVGATDNDTYRVTVADSVVDRAINPLDGEFAGSFPSGDGNPGGSFEFELIVFSPGETDIIFVGPDGSPNGDGSRDDPFDTIADGLAQAGIGDTVAALPGTYNEAVTLKSLVRLVSADPSSTDTNVVPGRAQGTVIRAPINDNGPTVTVSGNQLKSTGIELETELRGFTIVSPLTEIVDGEILPESVGLRLIDSAGRFHRNFIITGETGIFVDPTEGGLPNARILNNGLIGNETGLFINDTLNTSPNRQPVRVANNTIALNTDGMVIEAEEGGPLVAEVINNIFWQNRDRAEGDDGSAISVSANVANVRNNLFSGNGPDTGDPSDDIIGPVGFDPADLGPVPGPGGNFTGEASFVAPRDPRPDFDGQTIFLLDADFDLRADSAAIDAAFNPAAPARDFLFRFRVDVANRGFPGLGPADAGAFEFQGQVAGEPGGGDGGFPSDPVDPPGDDVGGPILFGAANLTAAEDEGGRPFNDDASRGAVFHVPVAERAGNRVVPQAGPVRRWLESLREKSNAERTAEMQRLGISAPLPRATRAWDQFRSRIRALKR